MKNLPELGISVTVITKRPRYLNLAIRLASQGKAVFTVQEAAAAARDLNRVELYKVLDHAENHGLLKRLMDGKYLVVPLEAGTERNWSATLYEVARAVVPEGAIAYWTAVRHWNWTTQLPRTVYIQSLKQRLREPKQILGMEYRVIRIGRQKFFGLEQNAPSNYKVTNKEKTLLDICDRPDLAGGLHDFIEAVKQGAKEVDFEQLDLYASRFPETAALKRLGFILTTWGDPTRQARERLRKWETRISKGLIYLHPRNREGTSVGKWQVVVPRALVQ